MRFETWYKSDLQRTPQVQAIMGNAFTQDNLGNLMGAVVTDGGEPVTLSGSVTGYVMRPDGNTVVVTGTLDGSRAYIILPEAAYAVPGMISVALRLVSGSTKTVLAAWAVNVQRTVTGDIIDPGTVVPSLDELLAQIDAMEQGTAAANQAASTANTKAALADQKATLANPAASNADAKAALANTAATNADTKAALANEKAALADQKATAADTAAAAAIAAKEAAELATDDAQDATEAANTAAQQALLVDNDGLFYVYVEEE